MEEDKTLNNIVNDDFGKIILKIRKERHLTQKALADLINVSDRTISKWENGQSVPDLICVKNMCKALGISPSSLVLDKKSKKEHFNDINHKILDFFNAKCILYLLFIILFIFLFIFYINNRDNVTIYKLKIASDDIYINDGYFIKTKYKNILVIDDIRLNRIDNYEDINLELYTYINGDKKVIYEKNSLENIYIDNFEDYSKYLTKDIINSISKGLYIVITINSNEESIKYEGTFSVVEKYHNNKIIKEKSTEDKEPVNTVAAVFKEPKINKALIKMGYKYDSIQDIYKKKNKNRIDKIDITKQTLSIVIGDNIVINYHYDKDFAIYLDKRFNDKRVVFLHYLNQKPDECIEGKCKNHYDEIDEIIGIYQEIKDIL